MSRTLSDLHLHSTASDGKFTPTALMNLAAEQGLTTVALTDHDTVEGLEEAAYAANQFGLEFIDGVELSTCCDGEECHILGYGFNPADAGLEEVFARQRSIRSERADAMIGRLNELGFDIEYDEVWAEARSAPISRVHIARVMQAKGYCATQNEVFFRYLSNSGPAYVSFDLIDAFEGIRAIHDAGGVAILAHPGKHYLYEDLKHFMDIGIDGFEYIHPSHNHMLQMKYINHARNHNLLVTGGSDFHGHLNKDFVNLGMVGIDREHVDKLLHMITKEHA